MRQELAPPIRAHAPVCRVENTPAGYGWAGDLCAYQKCVFAAASGCDVFEPYLALRIADADDEYGDAVYRFDGGEGTEADLEAIRELGGLLGVEVRVR